MKNRPKTGTEFELIRIVDESLTVQFEGLPPVLSTPHVVWLLEESAMNLLDPFLAEDEMTLGTHVDVEHLHPALVGDKVNFRSRVVQASDREILFRVEAALGEKALARGLHRRTFVSKSRLAKKLTR